MRWLRRLWNKSQTEKRLDSELQFHLEQQIAGYVASGLPPEEARRRAHLEFKVPLLRMQLTPNCTTKLIAQFNPGCDL
jgi:hypothetical protein